MAVKMRSLEIQQSSTTGQAEEHLTSSYQLKSIPTLQRLNCKSRVRFPSEQQLHEHMKVAHISFHAFQANRFSKRVCRNMFIDSLTELGRSKKRISGPFCVTIGIEL